MCPEPKVKIKLLEHYSKNWNKPNFAKAGDAGVDLRNATGKDLHLCDNTIHKIPTGVAVAIPSGYAGLIFERSGHGKNYGVSVHGRVIDAGYRGEIFILLSSIRPFWLRAGDRVAQVVFAPVLTVIEFVKELPMDTGRGSSGFGSSGIL